MMLVEANHDINMLQLGSYPYYLKQRILGDKGHLLTKRQQGLLITFLMTILKGFILDILSKENNYDKLAYETSKA